MGIIDKCTYTLDCEVCGEHEEASVLDKGSNWSTSHWSNSANFIKFDTTWEGGGVYEPQLKAAMCLKCGTAPVVSSKHNL